MMLWKIDGSIDKNQHNATHYSLGISLNWDGSAIKTAEQYPSSNFAHGGAPPIAYVD
jgi:hypothetical protein